MKQVVADVRRGRIRVRDAPRPLPSDSSLQVGIHASLISSGTERHVVQLAEASLFSKARQRPDQVKRVLEKARQEGLWPTIRQLREKLDEPMALGYSASGVVLSCGRHVQEFKPGDRIAVVGPHASVLTVGRNLCARIPPAVDFERAAYASVAAIALQGVRLAKLSLGERVLVIGLGLVGQITVALLKAQGCRVFGLELDPAKLDLARALGLDEGATHPAADAISRFSNGCGVDAAIITAATSSNAPIELSAEACRSRGRIVLVGVAGLNLPRPLFFQKELEFTVSSSLGPGRGDPQYEEKGIDYPIGHARWTARRNMEAVLDLMAAGKLPVEKLTTHRFSIQDAASAYDLIANRTEPHLGVVLRYPESEAVEAPRRLTLRTTAQSGEVGISLIGAGNFARLVLMPALAGQPSLKFRGICTGKGLTAVHSGTKFSFAFATTEVEAILKDEQTAAVVVATRHDLHARFVTAALRSGKHVFVEKPLCTRAEELHEIARCVEELGSTCPLVMVGFNRRFAPALDHIRRHFADVLPLSVGYRFAVGDIPANAWPHDMDVGGGRLIGEACHAIDACASIHGSPPIKVFAESVAMVGGVQTTDDRVFITMRHANGGISNISYQAGGDRSGPTERIEVFGGGRTGTVEGWDRVDLWQANRHRRARGFKDTGHAAGLSAFVGAVKNGGDWPIKWPEIYATAWASLAAVESIRSGLPIDFTSTTDDGDPACAE